MAPAIVAKIVLPVALLVGGGVAFATSSSESSPSTVRAWVDSPRDGATVAAGELAVRVHASTADGAIDELELVVDGDVVGSVDEPTAFGSLVTGEVTWTAEVGEHELVARAHVGDRTEDSGVASVLVVESLPPVPPLGAGPTGREPSTTTTTAPAPEVTTTTEPEATTTTEVPTSEATTTTTEAPLPDPPVIARLLHTPSRGTPDLEITITAGVTAPDPATTTVTIEARQEGADWTTVRVCTDVTEPCIVASTFGDGVWRYRAVAVDARGQQVIAGDDEDTEFEIFG